MLARSPSPQTKKKRRKKRKLSPEEEEQRARWRRRRKAHREHVRKKRARYYVYLDGPVIDMLVARNYLPRDRVFHTKVQVSEALSRFLFQGTR